jgi:hypothetical protein
MNEAASSVEPEVKTRFATVDDASYSLIKLIQTYAGKRGSKC